jgi:hypothetical protein
MESDTEVQPGFTVGPTDVPCPSCGADVGTPCPKTDGSHRSRNKQAHLVEMYAKHSIEVTFAWDAEE